MKTSNILPIAALLLSFTMSNAQEPPLPSELRKQISEWRLNTLPALDAEKYWPELKEIGSNVGETSAKRIKASGSSDTDSTIALMAYKAWSQPERIDEIAGWYGVYEGQVSRELRGVDSDEIWDAMQAGFNAKRTTFIVERLREEHKKAEFLPTWEAWMLSPYSIERRTMRQRMNEALAMIGDERTIAILIERTRAFPKHVIDSLKPDSRQNEPDEIRRIIRSIGGEAAVLGLLECVRIAEAKGYAGEGPDSIRNLVIYSLTSTYNPRELAANPEWEQSLRASQNAPATPGGLTPYDDKWKEFKPIIEAMLKDPKDLRAEDIRLLQDALAAMPRN